MPRTAHLEPHLTSEQLEAKFKTTNDAREAHRWEFLWLVSLKHHLDFAASVAGCSYSNARNILKKYNQHGPTSVSDQRKTRTLTSRPPLLDQTQRQKLFDALQQPHSDGGLWNGPKVAAWIEQETGRKQVLRQLGWDYLKRLGFSLQQPRPRHEHASGEEQNIFKKNARTGRRKA
jgi:transposase